MGATSFVKVTEGPWADTAAIPRLAATTAHDILAIWTSLSGQSYADSVLRQRETGQEQNDDQRRDRRERRARAETGFDAAGRRSRPGRQVEKIRIQTSREVIWLVF